MITILHDDVARNVDSVRSTAKDKGEDNERFNGVPEGSLGRLVTSIRYLQVRLLALKKQYRWETMMTSVAEQLSAVNEYEFLPRA